MEILLEPPQIATDDLWCVVRTKGREEESVTDRLQIQGFNVFLPLVRENLSSTPHPLYPTYLFATWSDEFLRHEIRRTRGVTGLLIVHGPSEKRLKKEVEILRKALDIDPCLNPFGQCQPGIKVLIVEGLYKGLEGIIGKRVRKTKEGKVVSDVCMVGVGMLGGVDVPVETGHCRPLVATQTLKSNKSR